MRKNSAETEASEARAEENNREEGTMELGAGRGFL